METSESQLWIIVVVIGLLTVPFSALGSDLTGPWSLIADADGENISTTLEIAKTGDEWTAFLVERCDATQHAAQMSNVELKGNNLTFTAKIPEGDAVLDVQFTLTFIDEVITGTATTPRGDIPLSGSRLLQAGGTCVCDGFGFLPGCSTGKDSCLPGFYAVCNTGWFRCGCSCKPQGG